MKAQIIIGLAVTALAAGFSRRAEADDDGHLGAGTRVRHTTRTVVESVGVPLLFYTSPQYSSSVYGSPDHDSSAHVPTYYGSSSYSSRYYQYQDNPWYTDRVYVRYEVVGSPAVADVQMALARRGYYRGAIDGVLGPMSRTAIWRYQGNRGLRATGAIDAPLLRALGMH